MKTRTIAAAFALASVLAAFAAPTVSADTSNSISILAHPCAFAPVEFGPWEASGAITDHGTFVRTRALAFPPNLPPFTPGVLVIEKFLFTSSSGTFRITVAQVTGVPNGRWRTTEGTGAYEDAEWHGTGVGFTFVEPVNLCRSTFALTGVTTDESDR
jgi:hypothetical protein